MIINEIIYKLKTKLNNSINKKNQNNNNKSIIKILQYQLNNNLLKANVLQKLKAKVLSLVIMSL